MLRVLDYKRLPNYPFALQIEDSVRIGFINSLKTNCMQHFEKQPEPDLHTIATHAFRLLNEKHGDATKDEKKEELKTIISTAFDAVIRDGRSISKPQDSAIYAAIELVLYQNGSCCIIL